VTAGWPTRNVPEQTVAGGSRLLQQVCGRRTTPRAGLLPPPIQFFPYGGRSVEHSEWWNTATAARQSWPRNRAGKGGCDDDRPCDARASAGRLHRLGEERQDGRAGWRDPHARRARAPVQDREAAERHTAGRDNLEAARVGCSEPGDPRTRCLSEWPDEFFVK